MENYDKLEQYILGELSADERIFFEKELSTNKSLAEELATHRKNEIVIKAAARHQLRKAVGSAYEGTAMRQHRRITMMRRLAVAAGFALFVTAGFWWLNNGPGKNSPDQLFAQYFEMPTAPAVRNGDLVIPQNWRQALDFYVKQDFQSAIPILQEFSNDENFEQKEIAKLLLGASLLSSGNAQAAIPVFEKISRSSSFYADAEWYRALALFKSGKRMEAKAAFEAIAGEKRHFKNKEAILFLESW